MIDIGKLLTLLSFTLWCVVGCTFSGRSGAGEMIRTLPERADQVAPDSDPLAVLNRQEMRHLMKDAREVVLVHFLVDCAKVTIFGRPQYLTDRVAAGIMIEVIVLTGDDGRWIIDSVHTPRSYLEIKTLVRGGQQDSEDSVLMPDPPLWTVDEAYKVGVAIRNLRPPSHRVSLARNEQGFPYDGSSTIQHIGIDGDSIVVDVGRIEEGNRYHIRRDVSGTYVGAFHSHYYALVLP